MWLLRSSDGESKKKRLSVHSSRRLFFSSVFLCLSVSLQKQTFGNTKIVQWLWVFGGQIVEHTELCELGRTSSEFGEEVMCERGWARDKGKDGLGILWQHRRTHLHRESSISVKTFYKFSRARDDNNNAKAKINHSSGELTVVLWVALPRTCTHNCFPFLHHEQRYTVYVSLFHDFPFHIGLLLTELSDGYKFHVLLHFSAA